MSNKLYEKHLRTTAKESANITREIACKFAEFIDNNDWKIEIEGVWMSKTDFAETTEELFDKYIENLK